MRSQVIPGARMLWIVTTKLIAPAIDAIVVRWMPRIQRSWPMNGLPLLPGPETGGYAYQPDWAAPPSAKKLPMRTIPPARKNQYDIAFRRGNAMSFAPIMSGTR